MFDAAIRNHHVIVTHARGHEIVNGIAHVGADERESDRRTRIRRRESGSQAD
jgi:hypothetical protein